MKTGRQGFLDWAPLCEKTFVGPASADADHSSIRGRDAPRFNSEKQGPTQNDELGVSQNETGSPAQVYCVFGVRSSPGSNLFKPF